MTTKIPKMLGKLGPPKDQEDRIFLACSSVLWEGLPWLSTVLQENNHRRESEAVAVISKSGHFGLLVSVAPFCRVCKVEGNGLWPLIHWPVITWDPGAPQVTALDVVDPCSGQWLGAIQKGKYVASVHENHLKWAWRMPLGICGVLNSGPVSAK